MRRPLSIAVAVAFALAGCGTGTTSAPGADGGALTSTPATPTPSAGPGPAASPAPPSWLYVQHADSGTFTREGDRWTLTLNDVHPNVAAFTDRPDRQATVEDPATFFGAWMERFAADPPNVAVVLGGQPSESDVFVVTLSDPVVLAAHGTAVRYTAVPVPADRARTEGPAGLGARSDGELPATFGDVSLFIDSVSPTPTGSMGVIRNTATPVNYSCWPSNQYPPNGWYWFGFTSTTTICYQKVMELINIQHGVMPDEYLNPNS